MEINVELTKDEYQSFIRKYYLQRNWTKRIAILAIIAVLLSVLMLLQMKDWGYYIFVYFVFLSVVLMVLFFVLPYCVLYLQMLAKLKKINDEPLRWLFKLSETGAEIDGGQGNKFFSWRSLNTVIANDFIVFMPIGDPLYFIPLNSSDDSAKLLELIRRCLKSPENKAPNPKLLYFLGVICLIPFIGGALGIVYIILAINPYKNKWIAAIGIAGLLVSGLVIYNIVQVNNKEAEYEKIDPQAISKAVPKDYLQLLINSDKISSVETSNTKLRSPITDFSYQQYHCLIYKIDSSHSAGMHLDKIITETYNDNHDNNGAYRGIAYSGDGPAIWVQMARPDDPAKIYLNLFGNGTRVVMKNDSIAYYHSDFKNFYIKYSLAGGEEFFGTASEKNDDTVRSPLELMFLKRKSSLYFILLYGNDEKTNLQAGTLYNLIGKAN